MEKKLPVKLKIVYALGQMGWSLCSFAALNLLIYFYMPPEEGSQVIFPAFISQGAIFLGLTVIGLIGAGGRVFDAFTDPMIAGWSDRSTSKFGRRRKYMAIAILPFALLSVLVFTPPVAGLAQVNMVWVILTVLLFYFAMTLYVTPFTALIPELGHTKEERLQISTYISVSWAAGFVLGGQAQLFQSILEDSMGSVRAFQLIVGAYAGISAILMALPVWLIDENAYAKSSAATLPIGQSIRRVFKNSNFRAFAISDFLYWVSLTFVQIGLVYYVIELLGYPKEKSSELLLQMFGVSYLAYFAILPLSRRFGKKRLVMVGFGIFSLCFIAISMLGATDGANSGLLASMGISREMQVLILVILGALPLGIFGILPNAIVGDLADLDSEETGESLAGMFYAVRTFLMKAGVAVATLVFPSFLAMDSVAGLRYSAITACVFCIIGGLVFSRFKETN